MRLGPDMVAVQCGGALPVRRGHGIHELHQLNGLSELQEHCLYHCPGDNHADHVSA